MAAESMTDTKPLVSVCIANYNGIGLIDDCLRSVMEQEGSIPVEILVHDDASSDGSVAYIRDRYPIARLIVSENNVGFCVANNRMAAEAKGRYLLLLNNDAALYQDALQAFVAEAVLLEQPAILSLPQFDAISGDLIDRGCLLDPFFNPVPNLDPNRLDVAMVIGACLWIPRDLWNELGGFPEWFGSIAEDMYLCGRARLAGYAVRALKISGYRHHQGKSFGGNCLKAGRLHTTYRRRALSERNKTYVLILLSPPLQLGCVLPIHIFLILLEGLLVALLKSDRMVWQAIYAPLVRTLWCKRLMLLDLRYKIQRGRHVTLKKWLSGFVIFPHKMTMLMSHGIPDVQ